MAAIKSQQCACLRDMTYTASPLRFLIDAQNPSLKIKHGIISAFVLTMLEE